VSDIDAYFDLLGLGFVFRVSGLGLRFEGFGLRGLKFEGFGLRFEC